MVRFLIGIFIVLHGLVQLWYVVLSQRLVDSQGDMGWTGESWIFLSLLGDGATRALAAALFLAAPSSPSTAGGSVCSVGQH
jgi:hypothetical protein